MHRMRRILAVTVLIVFGHWQASMAGEKRVLDFTNAGSTSRCIGDVALRLWWEGCPPIDECVVETRMHPTKKFGEGCRSFAYCNRETHPRTYILRRKSSHWIVIASYVEPVFPESYLNRN